jgi:DNA-binding transcriptional LysR family regulator
VEAKYLRYFMAVAEELHFAKAAAKLNMSQPPLSQQIMKLEQDLGVLLFIRDKRNVSLTEAGKRLVEHSKKIFALLEFTEQDVRETAEGRNGSISLGYVGPAMDGFLPRVLRHFKARYSKVRITLRHLTTRQQLEELRAGTLQAGFLRLYGHDTAGLDTYPVHRETYMLAVPSHHRLAKREEVAIHEISAEPLVFITRQSQPELYDEWFRIFSEEEGAPVIAQEAESYHTIMALVAGDLGLAIVPESTARLKRDGVSIIAIQGKKPEIVIDFCLPKQSRHPVARNLLAVTQEMVG